MLEGIKNNSAFKTIFIVGLIIILIITLLKLFISFNNGLNKFTMINMHHFCKEDIFSRYNIYHNQILDMFLHILFGLYRRLQI